MPDYNDLPHWFAARAEARLRCLYEEYQVASVLPRIADLTIAHRRRFPPVERERWNAQDAILITYGDMVRAEAERPLRTLYRFLKDQVGGVVQGV